MHQPRFWLKGEIEWWESTACMNTAHYNMALWHAKYTNVRQPHVLKSHVD